MRRSGTSGSGRRLRARSSGGDAMRAASDAVEYLPGGGT